MDIRTVLKKAVLLFAGSYCLIRRKLSGKTKLLFYGRTPMNYTMFEPMHKRIEEVSESEVFFCFENEDPAQDSGLYREEYIKLGVSPDRILPLRQARMNMWDAVVLADFKRPRYLWTTMLVYICHGVAAKNWTHADRDGKVLIDDYRYNSPLKEYDLIFFHNEEDYRNAKEKGLFKRADSGEVVGMSCLDDVLRNNTPEKVMLLKAGFIPPRFIGKRIILYAPTWDSSASFKKKGAEILSALSGLDAFVIVKPHPLCVTSQVGQSGHDLRTFLKIHFPLRNYLLITDTPYEVMPISDMIISDFSSITFEYSLLRRPIFLFESAETQSKVADREQYEMLKRCCFVFRDDDPITHETFSMRELDPDRVAAMEILQKKCFSNPGFATDIAAEKLLERGIIFRTKKVRKKSREVGSVT